MDETRGGRVFVSMLRDWIRAHTTRWGVEFPPHQWDPRVCCQCLQCVFGIDNLIRMLQKEREMNARLHAMWQLAVEQSTKK